MPICHTKTLSILLLFCVVWPVGLNAEPRDQPLENRKAWVAEQIQNLNADGLRERFQAERALLEAGPEILPLLPAPELLPNAAVRQAVRRIRLKLEEAKARASIKPSRVTIDDTAPLAELLTQIQKQTGNAIDADEISAEQRKQTVTLQVSDMPFWDVLGLIATKTGLRLASRANTGTEESALHLLPAETTDAMEAKQNVGAFRIEVAPLKFRPRFGDPGKQLLRVPLRLAAEPRLQPLFLKLVGRDFSARTKDGKNLMPFDPNAKLELPLGEGGNQTAFDMNFLIADPFEAQAVQFAGKATVTVAADSEEIEFTNLSKASGTARRRGGVTVALDEITFQAEESRPQRQSAKVRVTVNYDTGGPAFESHRSWIFHNRVFLEDGRGRRFERNSDFHTALQTDGGVIVEYNFDNLPGGAEDYSFTYVAPILIINVPVEFTFPELTVPRKR